MCRVRVCARTAMPMPLKYIWPRVLVLRKGVKAGKAVLFLPEVREFMRYYGRALGDTLHCVTHADKGLWRPHPLWRRGAGGVPVCPLRTCLRNTYCFAKPKTLSPGPRQPGSLTRQRPGATTRTRQRLGNTRQHPGSTRPSTPATRQHPAAPLLVSHEAQCVLLESRCF